MFRADDLTDAGFLSILFADGQEPLAFWDKQVRSGRIKRLREENDKDRFLCIELSGVNINSTFISSPPSGNYSLGITLPVLVLIIKNMKKYFCYQVQIQDDRKFRRRFRLTNIPGFHRRQTTVCSYPLVLEEGWNELSVNLAELCFRSYGTQYVETVRIEIHANCRLREVFFCERFDSMKTRSGRRVPVHDPVSIPMTTGGSNSERENNNFVSGPDDSMYSKYEQLANDKDSRDLLSIMDGKLENTRILLNKKSSTGKPKNEAGKTESSDTSSSIALSLGERLKRDMYFEKPEPEYLVKEQPFFLIRVKPFVSAQFVHNNCGLLINQSDLRSYSAYFHASYISKGTLTFRRHA
ncbi:unnamed protein product [Allacma fusca]|uniref:CFA20 domain-containing protein n=1 Tax=Allacma fusca TaxID=39272 RepID=A0A8J2K566_9HEXA|nr:unnamed protein product [Allacma fusca]